VKERATRADLVDEAMLIRLHEVQGDNGWAYATAWHDQRALDIFGPGKGQNIGGRRYDKSYQVKDVEFKSDNFAARTRSQEEITRLTGQAQKDALNRATGDADPHWHFEHDPRNSREMMPVLRILRDANIPMTMGGTPGPDITNPANWI
jgi:hypothetical protein